MLAETLYDARQLMRDLVDIATADPNELTAHRRVNCRHCHGVEFAYQWDDGLEFAKACADALDTNAVRARQKLKARELPSDAGGYGFTHNKLPNADCPKCKGEGVANVFVPDTTKLSVKGRKLFAGVKQTRNGLEIMQHDQVKARELIGKMLGVFVDKYKEVDPNAAPEVEPLPLDATEAARAYAKIMKDG